jgi:hypothetical protein
MVEGSGNRDYHARYEVADLGNSLTASNIPIHRIDGVKGNVSILVTAYAENSGTTHGPNGVTMRPVPPQESSYQNIKGDLRGVFCRADLNLDAVAGRVDVVNDFGRTVWRADQPIAAMDHRIVSQSGVINARLTPEALGKLRLALFTECGTVRLPKGDNGLQSLIFSGNIGDVSSRYWCGFFTGDRNARDIESTMRLYERIPAAVRGDRRPPGVDIISRGGTVTFEPIAGAEGTR